MRPPGTARTPRRHSPAMVAAASVAIVPAALLLWGRQQRATRTADAIVIAGCKVYPGGRPSPALVRRVDVGVALYHRGLAPRVLVTGWRAEACVGMALARAAGVPDRDLIAEPFARTTADNAAYSRRRLGPARVIVVSDDAHLARCLHLFRAHFADVQVHPVIDPSGWALAVREVGSWLRLLSA